MDRNEYEFIPEGDRAIVLIIDGRYFRGFSKLGHLQTSWSLPGAFLFATWRDDEIVKAEVKIESKGRKSFRRHVCILCVEGA